MRDGQAPTVVVADFDETLVYENTLLPLFAQVARKPMFRVVLKALVAGEIFSLGPHQAIKAQMYREILNGQTIEQIEQAARGIANNVRVNVAAMEIVRSNSGDDTQFVVASASLEEVVRTILEEKNITANRVIGTIAAKSGNAYTGELIGGECVGRRKAVTVQSVLAQHYTGYRVVALGNLPPDRALLKLADEAFVVDGDNISTFGV